MSNYKWVKMDNDYVQLRQEDFSSISSFKVNNIDPLLMKKLEENGVDSCLEGDDFLEDCRHVLSAIDRKSVTITAPLYEYNLDSGEFVLLSESYTDKSVDPTEYNWVKEAYQRCAKEVANEQAKIFEEQFGFNSRDGISSVITISSVFDQEYFYEQYIPDGYIKVCEKNRPFTRTLHDMVFLKKMNVQGQVVVSHYN